MIARPHRRAGLCVLIAAALVAHARPHGQGSAAQFTVSVTSANPLETTTPGQPHEVPFPRHQPGGLARLHRHSMQ
jgi:hypothetical protein